MDKLKEIVGGSRTLDMFISNFVYEKQGAKHKKVMRYTKQLPQNEIFTWSDIRRFTKGKYLLMHSVDLPYQTAQGVWITAAGAYVLCG